MLANVLDIEDAMIENSFTKEFPLAIFLDFESALRSIKQTSIDQVLA